MSDRKYVGNTEEGKKGEDEEREDRDVQVNVRLSRSEAAKLDAEIRRREKLDPGLSFSRGEILRTAFLKCVDFMNSQVRDMKDTRERRQ